MNKTFQTLVFVSIAIGLFVACNTGGQKMNLAVAGPLTNTTLASTIPSGQPSKPPTVVPFGPPIYTIAQQPETQIAQVGTFITFATRVSPETNAAYQWRFNGTNIAGATHREYFITPVSFTNVGAYSVEVTWPYASDISTNAYLSVYSLSGSNSTSGTLTSPVGVFAPASPTYYCAGYPGVTFDRYYQPSDAANPFFFFYGPNVATTAQPGPFVNSGHCHNLTITSIVASNGGRPSGVRLVRGFGSYPYDLMCEAGASGAGFSFMGLDLNSTPDLARYRVVIYYRAPDPSSGTISIKWTYDDGAAIF
jgi:hypothetical protein